MRTDFGDPGGGVTLCGRVRLARATETDYFPAPSDGGTTNCGSCFHRLSSGWRGREGGLTDEAVATEYGEFAWIHRMAEEESDSHLFASNHVIAVENDSGRSTIRQARWYRTRRCIPEPVSPSLNENRAPEFSISSRRTATGLFNDFPPPSKIPKINGSEGGFFGLIFGLAFFICLIGGAFWFYRRRQRSKRTGAVGGKFYGLDEREDAFELPSTGINPSTTSLNLSPQATRDPFTDQFQPSRENLVRGDEGGGARRSEEQCRRVESKSDYP